MNFHKDLLSMTQEVHYWERMRMSVPYIAMEINAQRDKYRVLRDNIIMVVRDYNKVLTALDKEERRLFHDRIRTLDRRIMPVGGRQKDREVRPRRFSLLLLFCFVLWFEHILCFVLCILNFALPIHAAVTGCVQA